LDTAAGEKFLRTELRSRARSLLGCGHAEIAAERDANTTSRDLKAISFDPWLKPLVLRIDATNRWFLNGEPVTLESFPGALKKSLSRRPDWFVYLEADPDLEFRVPAHAMDMIQELHAKVILMTPGAPRVTGR
jgi:biopolymer transport protein ExbD